MNEKVKKIIENWEKEAKTYRKLYDEEDIISIVDNKMIDEFFNYIKSLPEETIIKNGHFQLVWLLNYHNPRDLHNSKRWIDNRFQNEFGEKIKEINKRIRAEYLNK